jgi:serine/threonine protein kinase
MLYDFGLAKELKGPHENGKYKLSGNTGSWAYMAPEVAKGYKYNLSVDVYSYGILLWELLSGKYASEGNWNLDKEGLTAVLTNMASGSRGFDNTLLALESQ